MPDDFQTFQKFNDPQLADTMCELLRSQGVDCKVVNETSKFDVTFANNKFEPTIYLKVRSDEFVRAHASLEAYYQQQLDTLEPDYYLFSFSDDELLEIIQRPDEWGDLDHALAKRLLADHGKPVTAQQEATFQRQRLEVLSRPETTHPYWIFLGYVAAIAGGFVGFFIGYTFAFLKKILPDGSRVFIYSPRERRHGRRILIISAIFFPLGVWVLWLLSGAFINTHWF